MQAPHGHQEQNYGFAVLLSTFRLRIARRFLMRLLLIIILVLLLVGALPIWHYSMHWGYYPTGGLGLILVIVVVVLLVG
jgi:hypothetical protein